MKTKIKKINELYKIVKNSNNSLFKHKHNQALKRLNRAGLQKVFQNRFGQIDFENTLDYAYTKNDYLARLEL